MKGRHDLWRSAIALIAAVLAAVGAYSAYARRPIVPFLDSAVLLLGAEALVGFLLALWPGGQWSRRRRYLSLTAAVLGLVLMVPGPLVAAILVPGCTCMPDPLFPPLLGIAHQYWIIAGLIGFPWLLALASIHPVPSRRVETPPEPGASTAGPPEPYAPNS